MLQVPGPLSPTELDGRSMQRKSLPQCCKCLGPLSPTELYSRQRVCSEEAD